MTRRLRLIAVLVAVAAACSPFGSDEAEAEICRPVERDQVLAQKLTHEIPSEAFVVDEGEAVWVGVIADADYNVSTLFPSVADLYVIDEGARIRLTRGDLGLATVDDTPIRFDREGQFRPFPLPAGTYELWSLRGPDIEVVVCP
ncbi:MAG: hypothetical protein OEU32_17830 [Acidimicrobiia bacterium]|nr:hypothetical protein [Acidimicrobiia bacterium]